jgi:hypothetical protein
MTFDFKRHLIKVQGGRSYLPVSARIVWFRQEHPDWSIETEAVEINHEKQYAIFRARICDGDGKLMATGTKKEDVKGFGDYIEKAETGSVGRALALCGFGTQFSPELDESSAGRFADSPQPMGGGRFGGGSSGGNYGGGGGNGNSYGGGGAARYGSPPAQNGESNARYAPPRDSAPPREQVPQREQAPQRESNEPPRADAARPQPTRPAPVAVLDEGEDDFEALVGGDLKEVTEDDPFGDDAPREPQPMAAKPSAAAAAPSGTPACVSCNKALTKAQMELSVRNYGEAFCPGCQRDKTRRPALAER